MNFGERLTKILNEHGMSITTLANETGITYNMIKKYCSTNSEPTISYAEKMADVLGISLDELTGHVSKTKKSMFQEVFEEDMTYIKGFMRNVRRFADKTAVIDPLSETILSYSELNKIVNQFANALNDQGIGYKDVILYQLPNSLEYLYCYLAPQKLGAVNSPANYNFSPGETTVCLNLSRPKVYVYDGANKDIAVKALQAAEEMPQLVLMVGDGDLPEGHQRFADFLNGYPESEPITNYVPNMYDEVMRLYTSGTTGKPKGVPLYNANEVMSAHDVMMHFPMNPTDSTINTTPWFHRGGIHSGGPCPTLYAGATVVIMKAFQSLLALKYVEKYKITFLIGVPSIIKMLVRHQEKYKADLSSLRGIITMGAPFERADCLKVHEVLSPNLFNGYGTTETFWNTFLRPYDLPEMAGTAGKSCTDDDVRVVKYVEGKKSEPDDLAATDESETGEVIIRTPKSSYCYFNNPEEEANKFYKGWMYTGDLATWDKNHFITISGRKDDMIISGGENIYPPIIEEAINTHPKVAASAVTGIPDAVRGEAVVAYIVPEDDSLTVGDLVEHCNTSDLLSGYKRPRYYRFVKELPMTATGKLQHYLVKEMAMTDMENGLLKLAMK
ncbi:MAG: AMP-binding protein [Lachnospiraceae bacterium]|nr:AMP-binding protein [Lachnospiraceae bacterium]MDO4207096.1 AMP-binding protein [Lachnospiraceae bacterium]